MVQDTGLSLQTLIMQRMLMKMTERKRRRKRMRRRMMTLPAEDVEAQLAEEEGGQEPKMTPPAVLEALAAQHPGWMLRTGP